MTAPVTGSVRLRFSATSPFVRKVRLVIHETGQADRVQHVYANPWGDFGGSVAAEADNLRTQNPLSRLPTLLTADGQPLYDSPVICEYLDSLHDATPVHPPADPAAANPPTNPHGGVTRWTALTWQALADGMLDAQMLRLNEFMKRPIEARSQMLMTRWAMAVAAGLDRLEAEADSLMGPSANPAEGPAHMGQIAVAAMLAYLDFRWAVEPWRPDHPRLAAFYKAFSMRPAMAATAHRENDPMGGYGELLFRRQKEHMTYWGSLGMAEARAELARAAGP